MNSLLQLIGDGGHALAAALYAALAIYILRGHEAKLERNLLFAAVVATSLWALHTAFSSVTEPLSGLSESLRNGLWLLFMFVMLRHGEGSTTRHPISITFIYGVLGGVLAMQTVADLLPDLSMTASFQSLVVLSLLLRMMFAIGALVLVHNLFTISAPEGRARIALVMAALAAMWTYDLNLYGIAALSHTDASEIYALRGMGMAILALVMGVGMRGGGEWRLRLSRTVAFRSLSLVAVGLYLVVLAIVIVAIEWLAGPYARLIEVAATFSGLVAALVLLPSQRFRSLVKVLISKHFFQHRYDYRSEWMRFVDTIGAPDVDAAPIYERVVKAVADITESSSALLLLPDESGALTVECVWNWPATTVPTKAMNAADAAGLKRTGFIIDFDELRSGGGSRDVAPWMMSDSAVWALVPLIHFDRLIGAILLGRPRVDRRLDWEDFDMLRTAGRQVASYISEAQGQQALEDARRFDEFNRRFAFIIHDVKNLVSQLSLLSRNAERHADNPDFRADMILTLRDSVGKMNDLLARLSQHNKGRQDEPRAVDVRTVANAVATTRTRQRLVEVTGTASDALADPQRLEQILVHLVQNAIDASAPDAPVILHLGTDGDAVTIQVIDRGTGMSADFIRRDLFKPFSSSKADGFGIGAFEARELARSMDGRIDVESRVGEGSCFTLTLPRARSNHHSTSQERAA